MTDAPSTEIVQRNPHQELVARVRSDAFKQQIEAALPGNVTPARFVRATVTALMQNPDLVECEPDSLFSSLIKCGQDGLLPDGREAAIVKYKGKAQYLPMIGGFRKVAGEQGWTIRTQVVFANDEFEVELGIDQALRHVPARGDRGQRIAAYAVGAHGDGRREVEVMYQEDIERAKKVAQTTRVWDQWTDRMWEKTVGKRLFAKLPLGDRERVTRMLEADPAEAAAALYGPEGAQVFGDSPATPSGAEPYAAVGPGTADDSQQAAVAAPSEDDPPPLAAAAAPGASDFSDEPGGEPVQTSFEAPASVQSEAEELGRRAAGAGLSIVPDGKHKGLTIAQVASKGAEGEEWLLYVLKKFGKQDTFRLAVETYVHVLLPEVWAAYEAHAAAGGAS